MLVAISKVVQKSLHVDKMVMWNVKGELFSVQNIVVLCLYLVKREYYFIKRDYYYSV